MYVIEDKMTDTKIYHMGDFSFIKDESSREMIKDAYNATTKTEGGWEFIKTFTPPMDRGFMWCSHPKLSEIDNKMEMDNQHSGGSYAWTMRNIEYIGKHGWSAFVQLWLAKNPK